MAKQCRKCGYERQDADTAPDYECPKCGAVYAKVEAHLAQQEDARKGKAEIDARSEGTEAKQRREPSDPASILATKLSTGQTVAYILFTVVFIGVLANGGIPSAKFASTTVTVRPPPAINISAIQLFNDYHENEIAADGKYKGRMLQVTGTLSEISKDFMGNGVLALGTPNQFIPIHATLQQQELAKAQILEKGRIVQVECQGNGMILGGVMLKDCIIIDAGLAGRSP